MQTHIMIEEVAIMIRISIQICYESFQFKIQCRNPNILHTKTHQLCTCNFTFDSFRCLLMVLCKYDSYLLPSRLVSLGTIHPMVMMMCMNVGQFLET